jgi:SPP1 gp7 family putative phage head morphogenesis protein
MNFADLHQELQQLYSKQCCDLHQLNADSSSALAEEQWIKFADELALQIWELKGMPKNLINKTVTNAVANHLWAGVTNGYGKEANLFNDGKLDFQTPNFKQLANLQQNVWHFSAAKNYTQLRELSNALLNEDGKLRTFKEFKTAALTINEKQFNQYLNAEYNLAVAGATMAAKWVDIKANADVLPYLQFDAVIDKTTTDICRPLNGTVLPINHPFWNTYYPPNHFNCRSTVRQVSGLKPTAETAIPAIDIKPLFQTNLGKQGLAFPDKHSYYTNIPEGIKNGELSAFRKEMYVIAKDRLKGKSVEVEGLGRVGFNSEGLKEIFNQNHDQFVLKNQLATISHLLLKNAELITQADNYKLPHLKVYYLKVKGISGNFYLNVKQMEDGRKILYSITDKIK